MIQPPEGYYACSRPEIQRLVPVEARTILDVGCGEGQLGHELKQRQPAEIWGVEYVAAAAGKAAKRLDRVINAPIEQALPELPDRFFDTIICADLLEHLVDPWQTLTALKDKLAPGGRLVASIPNVQHWSVLKMLLEGGWEYRSAGILDRTHLRFFTLQGCRELFQSAGLTIHHAEATLLNSDAAFPENAATALRTAGLQVDGLVEASRHYQFLIVGSPEEPPVAGSDQSSPPLTSIVMLTWNQLAVTQACLASIAAHTSLPYELIIIDNGSSDGTPAWLQAQVSQDRRINVILNESNRGYAAGCNQGIAQARGERIMLLNNDTLVTTGWLEGLHDLLDRYPDAGIVGPMTNRASGVQVVQETGYTDPAGLPAWADAFRQRFRHRVVPQRRIVGFCMLFRRQLIDQIGLLDESFGIGNFEDDDLCLRAELAGYRNLIAGDLYIHHEGGASFNGKQMSYQGLLQQNRELFSRKWASERLDPATASRLQELTIIERAERMTRRGERQPAINLLQQWLQQVPGDRQRPYCLLVELLLCSGACKEALQRADAVPQGSDAGLRPELKARCLLACGADQAARAAAEQAMATGGNRAATLVVLGCLAMRQGTTDQAEAFFRQAAGQDPACGEAWLALGMLLWSRNVTQAAWLAVRQAVLADPLSPRGLEIMLDMAGRTAQQQDALLLLEGALGLYPDSRAIAQTRLQLLADTAPAGAALQAGEALLADFGPDDRTLELLLPLRDRTGSHHQPPLPGLPTLSLCMIVRDEEHRLARCLAGIKPLVQELVIVDTGSRDRTPAIASAFGAKLHHFPWNGSFSDARNSSLQLAQGDWALVLDADECLAPQEFAWLQGCLRPTDGQTAWKVLTRNYTNQLQAQGWQANRGEYPLQEQGTGWHPSWKVRLFPNRPDIHFSGPVHEMVEPELERLGYRIAEAPFCVHHYGGLEQDRERLAVKRQRYFEAGLQKLQSSPGNANALRELAVLAGELGHHDKALQLWDRLLQRDPSDGVALYNKGAVLMAAGRYAEALTFADLALQKNPHHREAAFNYAVCSLYAGEPEAGLAVAERLLVNHPDDPPLLAILTALLLSLGRLDTAQQSRDRLAGRKVMIDDYIRDRASILEQQGRTVFADRLSSGWASLSRTAPDQYA
jgi:GT2 family glycosyltransferase/Tfp pilus assembly protein PilF/SAM-dependent methyltransferase